MYREGKYALAFNRYLECLWDLLPWYASPITLTANVCFDSGLAEL